jgi:hypothetical protein
MTTKIKGFKTKKINQNDQKEFFHLIVLTQRLIRRASSKNNKKY